MAPVRCGFVRGAVRFLRGRLVAGGPTIVGAALALWGLGTESLWLDEATSVTFARMPFDAFWRQAAGPEINATAYYLLLRAWVTFGTDETWVRLLSAIFAIATIPAVHLLGRRLFGEPVAAIAALVLAMNPFFVEFAQEARGYSLALLLSSLSSLAFVLALERSTPMRWGAWILLSSAGLYAHMFTAFVVAAQLVTAVVAAAIREPSLRQRLRPLAVSTAAAALLAIPMLLVVMATGRGHLAHIPPPTPLHILRTVYLVTGRFWPLTIALVLVAAAAAVAAVAAVRGPRRRDIGPGAPLGVLLAWSWLFVPFVASLVISFVKPILYARYLIVLLPGIALVAGLGVASLRPRRLGAGALAVVVAASLVGSVLQAVTLSKEDWRGAAAIVLDRAEPGDGIAFVSSSVAKPFAYYVARSERADVAPTPIWPEVDWLAPRPIVAVPKVAVIRDRVVQHDRVWLVVSHEARSLDELATIVGALQAGHIEREVIKLRRVVLRLWIRPRGDRTLDGLNAPRPVPAAAFPLTQQAGMVAA